MEHVQPNESLDSRKRVLQVRCLIALCAEVFGTWLNNTYLYPQFLGIMPEARDLASLVGIFVLVALALAARRKPSALVEDRLTMASLCVYGFGCVLILLGLLEGSVAALAVGACLRSAGSRWFVILTGLALCRLSGRACMLCIAGAYALDYLLRIPVNFAGSSVALVVLFACPLMALICARPYGAEIVAYSRSLEPPIQASVTEPMSFVSFGSIFFFAIFLFRIAYGFALSFETVEGVPQQTLLSAIPILLLLVLVRKPRLPKADVLYMAACLLIIAGFLVVVILRGSTDAPFARFANGLLFVGSECFEMLMFFTLASIGSHNKGNAIAIFAWGKAASSSGLLFGVVVGHGIAVIPSVLTGTLVVGCVLFGFVALNLTLLKNFSFQDTIDGVQSLVPLQLKSHDAETDAAASAAAGATVDEGDESARPSGSGPEAAGTAPGKAATPSDPLAEKAASVAAECGLTPRESEIMLLLAHGRNAAFLQEKLVLSRNTVKTHVANIYAKMGVHSQQELIDIVEAR